MPYWGVLGLLALVHVVVTTAVFVSNPGRVAIKFFIVSLLIIGQWQVLQMVAMQVIWRLRGFAP